MLIFNNTLATSCEEDQLLRLRRLILLKPNGGTDKVNQHSPGVWLMILCTIM